MEFRRTRFLKRAAVATLPFLTILSIAAGFVAVTHSQTLSKPPDAVPQLAERANSTRAAGGADVDLVLGQIQEARHWKGKVDSPTDEFLNAVGPQFDRWREVLTELSSADRRADADRICAAIHELQRDWGAKLFPLERFEAFGRDRFVFRDLRIDAAEFFAPVPYYPGDATIVKLFRFSVYRANKVVLRYYLEKSNILEVFYVLTRVDPASNSHAQIKPYGRAAPDYWDLKHNVLNDLARSDTR